MKNAYKLIVALLLACVVLSSCGKTEEPTPTPEPTPQEQTEPEVTPEPEVAPEPEEPTVPETEGSIYPSYEALVETYANTQEYTDLYIEPLFVLGHTEFSEEDMSAVLGDINLGFIFEDFIHSYDN